jgi:hypothetical protein
MQVDPVRMRWLRQRFEHEVALIQADLADRKRPRTPAERLVIVAVLSGSVFGMFLMLSWDLLVGGSIALASMLLGSTLGRGSLTERVGERRQIRVSPARIAGHSTRPTIPLVAQSCRWSVGSAT